MSSSDKRSRRFGVVLFDNDKDPSAGWACVAGEPQASRIMHIDDLSTGIIWWTNITYKHFYIETEIWRKPFLRQDKYLVVSHADALREWGYDPKKTDVNTSCVFLSRIFDRIMRMAYGLIRSVNPRITLNKAFEGKNLREDIRVVLPEADYPKAEAASIMKNGQAFGEFTITTVQNVRDSQILVLRKPRIIYALEMLNTPVPSGPFEHHDKGELRSISPNRDISELIRTSQKPCMVELSVERIDSTVSPVLGFGNATNKDKRVNRNWVTQPEFFLLDKVADIDVKSSWIGHEYKYLISDIPSAVKEFLLDKYSSGSWSAGVLAETIWRASTLAEEKWKIGSSSVGDDRAETSWQGAWIKGADKNSMFLTAIALTKLGYPVLSYGIGWVRCAITKDRKNDFLNDGLSLGLLPNMSDIPDGFVSIGDTVNWGGDEKMKSYAHFSFAKRGDVLWNLDRVPIVPPDSRKAFIKENVLNKLKS